MSTPEFEEVRQVLLAQRDLIHRMNAEVSRIEVSFAGVEGDAKDLSELGAMMDSIEADAEWLSDEDLPLFDRLDPGGEVTSARANIAAELRGLDISSWSALVRGSGAYLLEHGIDPFLPFESMLCPEDLDRLRRESYGAQYAWDRWDYIFVGSAGVLAAFVDYFLVALPKTMVYGGAIQGGSPITAWMKRFDTTTSDHPVAEVARWLEERCKVPFDVNTATFDGVKRHIGGMSGRSHRFQTLGHDPALGLLFGVLDILRGTVTGFEYNISSGIHRAVTGQVGGGGEATVVRLIEAVLKWFGHMLSDVATPDGLPPPFFTLLQAINAGSFGPNGRSVAEIARWMYLNGYDLRHFLTMGIVPGVIELVVRGYLMIRAYAERGEVTFPKADNPKHRLMLLSAHSIAAAGNAGKVALLGGNPVAINLAQWMATFRYLMPTLKFWLFDKERLRLEHLHRVSDEAWDEIEANTARLVTAVRDDLPLMELGNSS